MLFVILLTASQLTANALLASIGGAECAFFAQEGVTEFRGADIPACLDPRQTGMSAPPNCFTTHRSA